MPKKNPKKGAAKKAAAGKTGRKPASGDPMKRMKAAIAAIVIPALRQDGFDGGYPNLRRVTEKRTDVMWFELDPGMNGSVEVGLAKVARRSAAAAPSGARGALVGQSQELRPVASAEDSVTEGQSREPVP